jgi:hypothetical protein
MVGNIHFLCKPNNYGEMLWQLGLSVIAHLFKGFAIFVLSPCSKRYIELQCIYNASMPPKQLITVGGGTNGEYMFCMQLFFCNVIVALQHFRNILLCSMYIGVAVHLYYIALQYIWLCRGMWTVQNIYAALWDILQRCYNYIAIFSSYLPSIYNTFKLKCPPYHCSVYSWFRSREDPHGTWVVEQEFERDSALVILICDLCDLCADVSCLSSRSINLRTSWELLSLQF